MLIDSHVNLHAPQFAEDREAVIERARAAGVGLMVTISDRLDRFPAVLDIAKAHPDIWATVGAHPHEAKDHQHLTAQTLIDLAAHPRVVGIGETGLDFHYDLSPREIQASVFRTHIAAARETALPLVVHTREADDAMAEILEAEYAAGAFPILMHCYTSGAQLARRMAALGAWFSVSEIATFRAANEVRAVIAEAPADRIILETDCPYLAPVPMRGRRNEPAFLPHVLTALAAVRGWSVADAERRTEDAFFNLFEADTSTKLITLEFTILGCGSSGGVPRADGNWGLCDPAEPKNRRTRCSLMVRRPSAEPPERWTTVVVDTSPEFRLQTAEAGAKRLDAVLLTHDHADQLHGLDDIRAFALRQRQRIDVWMDDATRAAVMRRFGYVFEGEGMYPAIATEHPIPPHGTAWAVEGPSGSIQVVTFDQDHGGVRSVGYRFGDVAYSSDVVDIPRESLWGVKDLDVWIVDALKRTPHPTHFSYDDALAWIARMRPRREILTNMHIDLDWATMLRELPDGVDAAFDGLRFTAEIPDGNI